MRNHNAVHVFILGVLGALALVGCELPTMTLGEIAGDLSTRFAELDTDGDDQLSFAEALAGNSALTQAQFDAIDTNNDGFLSASELDAAAMSAAEGEGEGEGGPTAAFTATPIAGIPPLTVLFADQSDPGSASIINWGWDFGDGQSSTEQNPVHVYNSSGVYQVTLSVITTIGGDTETKANYITALRMPQADFTASPRGGLFPLRVEFTNLSMEAAAPTTVYEWDFGDGTTSTEANPTHVYDAPGKYTVELRVTTLVGESLETKVDYVSAIDEAQESVNTEDFSTGGVDLEGKQLYFQFVGSIGLYTRTATSGFTAFSVPTTGQTPIDFSRADPFVLNLAAGSEVMYFGQSYSTLYIGSDGTIAFGSAGTGNGNLTSYFQSPQVSLLPVDATGTGTVSYRVFSDSIVVTFSAVDRSSFQSEFFIRGPMEDDIAISYISVSANAGGVVGLSRGQLIGLTPTEIEDFLAEFLSSDLSVSNTSSLKLGY